MMTWNPEPKPHVHVTGGLELDSPMMRMHLRTDHAMSVADDVSIERMAETHRILHQDWIRPRPLKEGA